MLNRREYSRFPAASTHESVFFGEVSHLRCSKEERIVQCLFSATFSPPSQRVLRRPQRVIMITRVFKCPIEGNSKNEDCVQSHQVGGQDEREKGGQGRHPLAWIFSDLVAHCLLNKPVGSNILGVLSFGVCPPPSPRKTQGAPVEFTEIGLTVVVIVEIGKLLVVICWVGCWLLIAREKSPTREFGCRFYTGSKKGGFRASNSSTSKSLIQPSLTGVPVNK